MTYRELGLSACLVLCVLPTHAQEQTVTPKEIQDAWVGRALAGTTGSGAPVTDLIHSSRPHRQGRLAAQLKR